MVYYGASMARQAGKRTPSQKARVSITFSVDDYKEMEQIAAKQRVSIAWVVRDAVAGYLAERNPLFLPSSEGHQLDHGSR